MPTFEIPEPGTPATVRYAVDCHAATVISSSETIIRVQCDTATRTDSNGLSETQVYEYKRNPNGTVYTFTRRRDGAFREKGCKKGHGVGLTLGVRREYRDPSG